MNTNNKHISLAHTQYRAFSLSLSLHFNELAIFITSYRRLRNCFRFVIIPIFLFLYKILLTISHKLPWLNYLCLKVSEWMCARAKLFERHDSTFLYMNGYKFSRWKPTIEQMRLNLMNYFARARTHISGHLLVQSELLKLAKVFFITLKH